MDPIQQLCDSVITSPVIPSSPFCPLLVSNPLTKSCPLSVGCPSTLGCPLLVGSPLLDECPLLTSRTLLLELGLESPPIMGCPSVGCPSVDECDKGGSHSVVYDHIDITPDRSEAIEYCSKCFCTFK